MVTVPTSDRDGSRWAIWNWRSQLVSPLRGRVLEIGCGTGPTFRHYHPSCQVWAVEKETDRCQEAMTTAQASPAQIRVQQGNAQSLPFPADFFDAVLSSLVLCSVPQQQATLAEIGRVLHPSGTFSLMEHVLPRSRGGSWLAHAIQPWWSARLNGCHPNRDTVGTMKQLGWQIRQCQRTACVIRGTFTPPPRHPWVQITQGCTTIRL